jgi:predicted phage-related endonuclease
MEYKQFIYERDKVLEDLILKADMEFWECVQKRIAPDPTTTSDCRLKFPKPHPDKIADCTYKILGVLAELMSTKDQMKRFTDFEERLKMKIMSHMGNAEYLYGQDGEILATWKANKKGTRVFNIK